MLTIRFAFSLSKSMLPPSCAVRTVEICFALLCLLCSRAEWAYGLMVLQELGVEISSDAAQPCVHAVVETKLEIA